MIGYETDADFVERISKYSGARDRLPGEWERLIAIAKVRAVTPAPAVERACANCDHYWDEKSVCRRQPPIRLPRKFVPGEGRTRDESVEYGWPSVERTDRCGEFLAVAACPDQLAIEWRVGEEQINQQLCNFDSAARKGYAYITSPVEQAFLDLRDARAALSRDKLARPRSNIKPCSVMSEKELRAEWAQLGKQWVELMQDDEGHAGSPGEWIVERSEEIKTELKRRGLAAPPRDERERG